MLSRTLRLISWIVVVGLAVYFVYMMETYEPEKKALGQNTEGTTTPVPKDVINSLHDLSRYEKVAENSRLLLYYEPFTSSLAIKDKETRGLWMSASDVSDEILGGSQLLKNSVRSVFNFSYSDVKRPVHEVSTTNSISAAPAIQKKEIEHGIRVTYEFAKLGISFDIEYTISDDRLEVYIPAEDIKESGSIALVSIEPLPNLGSGSDIDKGYVFYPDGSGALTYFKEGHPEYRDNYSALVFGEEEPEYREMDHREENAFLPVFGIHKNGNAFVAYVTEGEFESKINFYPSGYRVNLNRASSEYLYRRVYSGAIRRGEFAQRVEEKLLKQDHRTRYIFLSREASDYSAMANHYREYLLESGKLQKRIDQEGEIPVAIDLFTGIKEERVLKDRFVKATTFMQAQAFLEQLKGSGVNALNVILRGWMDDGYGEFPMKTAAAGELGGKSDLQKLKQFAHQQSVELYLNFNIVDADDDNRGFSKQLDTMKSPNKLPIKNFFGNRYLLNAEKAKQKYIKKQSEQLDEYGLGLDYERLGQMALADYNDFDPLSRKETVDKWLEVVDASKKKHGKAAVHGGNGYVLPIADRLSDIPLGGTGYVFTDESIPFYQMIIHGYVPYSGDIPQNMHYEPRKQFLKWIEYGSMPYYELSHEKPEEFRFTEYKGLFSSTFEQWAPVIVEQYKEINENIGHTWAQQIIRHHKLDRDVIQMIYSDGTQVIINYRSTDFSFDGSKVEPMGYIVLKEGDSQ